MEPSYERFDSEASYLAAIDFVLAQAKSSPQSETARMHVT